MSKNLWSQIGQVSVALCVIASLWFALEVGAGEVYTAITDPLAADANTTAAYGGNIDFIERVGTVSLGLIALGPLGLGAVGYSKGNPRLINDAIKFAMPIAGLIAFVTMSDTFFEFIRGDRVWSAHTDAINAWVLAMCSAVVAGASSVIRKRGN